eukprot:TRINITY_DN49775_c0_g1_i1.p2 TRINITY_DN49775_c0_g1~~TRINITY_DN49775_c0_g1_i1.p2  ORF type:complete len:110 (-),score=20.23 TRINITY_DN49775_c0_g1_i1:166-495(-)
MATGGPSATEGKEVDVRHTCSLCMEDYWGRIPKMLPCHHTFCLPCLTALELSVRSARREAGTEGSMGQAEGQKEHLTHGKGQDEQDQAQPPPPELPNHHHLSCPREPVR